MAKSTAKPCRAPISGQRVAIAPATHAEKRVLALWQELLNAPNLSVEDNFFEVGGNSLTAMQLLTRLQQEFSVQLSIQQLFAALTPRAQATLVVSLAAMQPEERGKKAAAIPALSRQLDAATLPEADIDVMHAQLLADRKETAS